MDCRDCGERMIHDYMTVLHCPNAEWDDYRYVEPDSQPVHCGLLIHVSQWKGSGPIPSKVTEPAH